MVAVELPAERGPHPSGADAHQAPPLLRQQRQARDRNLTVCRPRCVAVGRIQTVCVFQRFRSEIKWEMFTTWVSTL